MFSIDEMDFSELIQSYFLKRTGKGLIFSSRDLDLLLKWEASGCSAGTICKGIDAAVERANRTPRDLFACRKYVEEGMGIKTTEKKTPGVTVGKKVPIVSSSPESFGEREELLVMVKGYARKNPHSDFQKLYADALQELTDFNIEIDAFAFEEKFYESAFSSLPANDQKEIDEEIVRKLNAVLSTMSSKARLATITAKRRSYMEERMSSDE